MSVSMDARDWLREATANGNVVWTRGPDGWLRPERAGKRPATRIIVNLTPGEWNALQLVPAKKRLQAVAQLCARAFPQQPEIRVRYDPREGAYGTRWKRLEGATP